MSKRTLCFDWFTLEGARKNKRKLHLEPDPNGMYICPVSSCLHVGFKSQRGLRKHIKNKHDWYYYFDEQPNVKREDGQARETAKRKASTYKQPSFAIDKGCGAQFVEWLQTPCGGAKSLKDARQVSKRGMKYLMYCVGDCEDGISAPDSYIDCCVGSPTMLMKFLKLLMEEWNLKSAGALSYMQAITDLCDFRKCHGVPDSTLRLFAVTEVYLRRTKSTLYRKKNVEYSRNLSLESLIAERSWATLEEIEKVIPYHSPKYQDLFKKAANGTEKPLTVPELAFATRFLITFLLLRVKCTRPMSLQFLTTEMIEHATKNDGFVDQTRFKTQDQFLFDSLKFSNDSLDVVNTYIRRIRPLCNPKENYVILTTNGKQYTAFCNAMSILTHEAIGKHITPTRYRSIVESESVVRLDREKQAIISKDQKHSSQIARRCYQKRLSREVAEEGANAMKELVGNERETHTGVLASNLRGSSDLTEGTEAEKADEESNTAPSTKEPNARVLTVNVEPIVVEDASNSARMETEDAEVASTLIQTDNIEVKKEELEDGKKFLSFSTEEDKFLRLGFKKHSNSKKKWADILKDKDFEFQEGRTRDSLRMRATTLGLEKKNVKRKSKSK